MLFLLALLGLLASIVIVDNGEGRVDGLFEALLVQSQERGLGLTVDRVTDKCRVRMSRHRESVRSRF